MPSIDINGATLSSYSASISNGAVTMQAKSLGSQDAESTIKGNSESKEAFLKSQQMLANMVELIQGEAEKIQQLGNEFTKVDSQLANMVKQISS